MQLLKNYGLMHGVQKGDKSPKKRVRYFKSTNTDAAAGTKVQMLTQLLVQKYK